MRYNQDNFNKAVYNIKEEIQEQFEKFQYVWESEKVDKGKRERAKAVVAPPRCE